MSPLRRFPSAGAARATTAALALGVVMAAGLLSACDASPYAAQVNGTTISTAALNNELRWSRQAHDYSSVIGGNYSQLTNTNLTLTGATPNSYSTAWVAFTLSQMVRGTVVRKAVAATGSAPSADLYAAALGGIEIENDGVTGPQGNGGVTQMAPAYLTAVTQRLADHSYLQTPLPTAQLQGYYANYMANFYSQVCVRQATVTVTGPSGGIDFAASRTQAMKVATEMTTQPGTAGGSYNCYSHEQVVTQSPQFINTVVALAPGHSNVTETPYGYQVTAVASRQTLPLAGPVAQVLTTLVYDLRSPTSDSTLQRLLAQARVRVNPAFGTWQPGGGTRLAAVVAPRAPATAPVGSNNSGVSLGSAGSLVGP